MWPFKQKEIHNPDCYMCSEQWYDLKIKGKCSRTGCNNPAEGIIFHFLSKGSGARWSYVCYPCEREHNAWFYGSNIVGEDTNGWLFTPPKGVVMLPPAQHATPPDPDPYLYHCEGHGTKRCFCPSS